MLTRKLIRERRAQAIVFAGVFVFFLSASCSRKPEQPKAAYAPTPDQNGTGDRLGLFRDDTGTIWGIPLMYDEGGNLLGCAPTTLRDAPVTDKIPADTLEIVGAANEPSGWRGGTGKLELLFRDTLGGFRWQSITSGTIRAGPLCWSQSTPVQPLPYYRLIKTNTK